MKSGLTNAQLISGIALGEDEVIQWFYNDVFPIVREFVIAHSGNESEAHDVFQDGMMILYKRIKSNSFAPNIKVEKYLISICRNVWYDRVGDELPVDPAGEQAISQREPDLFEEEGVLNDEVKYALFFRHFNRLEKVCRDILVMFFSGISYLKMCRELKKYRPQYLPKKKNNCLKKLIESIRKDPEYMNVM